MYKSYLFFVILAFSIPSELKSPVSTNLAKASSFQHYKKNNNYIFAQYNIINIYNRFCITFLSYIFIKNSDNFFSSSTGTSFIGILLINIWPSTGFPFKNALIFGLTPLILLTANVQS